jgi:hypothetical protein
MGIRERTWEWNGKTKKAWVYEWRDLKGKKRLKTFRSKKQAQDFESTTRVDIKNGTHIADGDSITVAQAGELWLATCQEDELKRSSIARNRNHAQLHINPLIGSTKLNKLTVAAVRTFADRLRDKGRSKALSKMVLVSLGSILADAHERGLATSNPVRDLKRRRSKRKGKAVADVRPPLAIGVDIPHPDEIRTLLGKATGKRRAFCCPSRVLWAARWRAHTPFARIVDPTRHGFPHGLMATTGPPAAAAGLFRSQCQASQAAAGCLTITPRLRACRYAGPQGSASDRSGTQNC